MVNINIASKEEEEFALNELGEVPFVVSFDGFVKLMEN